MDGWDWQIDFPAGDEPQILMMDHLLLVEAWLAAEGIIGDETAAEQHFIRPVEEPIRTRTIRHNGSGDYKPGLIRVNQIA